MNMAGFSLYPTAFAAGMCRAIRQFPCYDDRESRLPRRQVSHSGWNTPFAQR
jgi:hypothetical protein